MLQIIPYQGWQNTIKLANDTVELIIPLEIGIRIIHFGFVGGENEFVEIPADLGKTGGDAFRFYGGHRLWHAPEDLQRTYQPDNAPITYTWNNDVLRVVQPIEAKTGIEKSIEIRLTANGAQVTHTLTNHNLWGVTLAPWGISAMRLGGKAILPLPPRGSHSENLVPTSSLILWAYTDLTDPRWTLGRQYVLLDTDPNAKSAQKIGASVPDGWAAYVRNGNLFIKTFDYDATKAYPDLNASVELYTDNTIMEVETLAPTVHLHPGESAHHTETWGLHRDVPTPQHDDDVIAHILPKVRPL